ncbi:MAG: NADAR family protein [Cyanobacteria bacterium SZAS LIN-5]|nr:NADAR family protein [Cyanobacteria bacterium SZAS LIN-5]
MDNREQPLNIGSIKGELIAKEMSNFEHSPFQLDGRRFESVEGFYVWLKFTGNEDKQKIAQTLYSYEAKKFGKSSTATSSEYGGETFALGSPQHHALIKRAIQAKLVQHPDIARRFAETHPRPIIHDFGYPEAPSRLPAAAFVKLLEELRDDLVTGRLITELGTAAELSAKAAAIESAKRPQPIAEALRVLAANQDIASESKFATARRHPLLEYASALEESQFKVVGLVAAGTNSIVLELPDNLVLKISSTLLPAKFRRWQFHLHILEKFVVTSSTGYSFQLYTQPKGASPVRPDDFVSFEREVRRMGWELTNPSPTQLCYYNGSVKLHDAFGAYKIITAQS